MPHLSVKGVQLHYALEGKEGAPVVALSNSLSTDMRMWQPQMAALAAKYRVLRYDVRGHGKSAVAPAPYSVEALADDLAGLVEGLGLGPVHVVGLSLGGMTAQVLAVRRPELVLSLGLVATTCRPPFGTQAAWAARAQEVRDTGDFSIIRTYLHGARSGAFVREYAMDGVYWVDIGTPEKLAEVRARVGESSGG